jgi:hypothetical protein
MIDAWPPREGLDERMRMNTADAITLRRSRAGLQSELDKLTSDQLTTLQQDLLVKLRGACAPNDADAEEIFEIAATLYEIDGYIDNQDPRELETRKLSDG